MTEPTWTGEPAAPSGGNGRQSAWPVDRHPGALLVDARGLHASGIGRYLRELLTRWLADPPFETMTLLGAPTPLHAFLGDVCEARAKVDVVAHDGGFYSLASQRSWLRAGRGAALRSAATFFPHWDSPLVAMPARSVVTVHDIIPFRVPDAFSRTRRVAAAPLFRRAVRRAARVVCVSHATARDVADVVPGADHKIRVVPNGVPAAFHRRDARREIDGRYLLAVGNQKPHKNLAAAVGVLERVRAAGHDGLRLVVAGRRFGRVDGAVARGIAAGHVIDVGETTDERLRGLYAHAEALVFPSRYEGFGLPVLEAMAMGLPVVASATPAVAEVVGDAAPTFAPGDVDGMSDAVRRLLDSPHARAQAIGRGLARAACFSWDEAARETARLLQEVAVGTSAGYARA